MVLCNDQMCAVKCDTKYYLVHGWTLTDNRIKLWSSDVKGSQPRHRLIYKCPIPIQYSIPTLETSANPASRFTAHAHQVATLLPGVSVACDRS